MLKAEIVYPKEVKVRKRISCDDCEIDYSRKSYSLLFKANKIAYFNVCAAADPNSPILLCHNCLFHVMGHIAKEADLEDGLDFTVIDKENEYKFNFIYGESFNGDEDGDGPDDFLTQFKK